MRYVLLSFVFVCLLFLFCRMTYAIHRGVCVINERMVRHSLDVCNSNRVWNIINLFDSLVYVLQLESLHCVCSIYQKKTSADGQHILHRENENNPR